MSNNESIIVRAFENELSLDEKFIHPLTVSTNYNTTGDRPNNRLTVKDESNLFRGEKEPQNASENTTVIDELTGSLVSVRPSLTQKARPHRGGLVVIGNDPTSSSAAQYDSPSLKPWLDNNPKTPSNYPSSLSSNLVKSNRAIILDPYQSQFASQGGDEADEIEATLKKAGYIVEKKVNEKVKIEDFKNLNRYGVIAFVSYQIRLSKLTYN